MACCPVAQADGSSGLSYARLLSVHQSAMNNLKCDCGKRIHVKGREHCATCWRKLTPEGKADGSKRQKDYQKRIKEHFAGSAVVAACILIASHPVNADVFDPAGVPMDPARPGWRPPHRNPGIPANANSTNGNRSSDVDDAGGGGEPFAFDTFGRWQATLPSPLPRPMAPPVVRCRPLPVATVPGPLPVLGVAAAWGWARRLRRRVRV